MDIHSCCCQEATCPVLDVSDCCSTPSLVDPGMDWDDRCWDDTSDSLCGDVSESESEDVETEEESIEPEQNKAQLAHPSCEGSTVFTIFDWDDTLFPTSYVSEVLETCAASGIDDAVKLAAYSQLRKHSKVIVDTLRAARAFGVVAIVTMSAASWIDICERTYLFGFNLSELLRELDISIYYSRDQMEAFSDFEAIDTFVSCKAKSMIEFLERECQKSGFPKSVLCVGDSDIEFQAIGVAIQCCESVPMRKRVKFVPESSPELLGHQLRTTVSWMRKMVTFEDNFDLVL